MVMFPRSESITNRSLVLLRPSRNRQGTLLEIGSGRAIPSYLASPPIAIRLDVAIWAPTPLFPLLVKTCVSIGWLKVCVATFRLSRFPASLKWKLFPSRASLSLGLSSPRCVPVAPKLIRTPGLLFRLSGTLSPSAFRRLFLFR